MFSVSTNCRFRYVALLHVITWRQILHCLVNALQLSAWHWQIAPLRCTAGQHHCIMRCHQHINVNVVTNCSINPKFCSLLCHLLNASVNMSLFHFEFGNAVTQQTADAIIALQHHHIVSGTCELLCCSQACRTRTDDGNTLASLVSRNKWSNPAFVPRTINNFDFNLLDRNWILIDTQNACRLARCRTQTASELRKIICCMQAVKCVTPIIAVYQVVPVGNQVAKRAAIVAKRNAAIHAPARLMLQVISRKCFVDLAPVCNTHWYRATLWRGALPINKSCWLTH